MSIQNTSVQQVRVLVVDDDPRVQKDMIQFLEEEGYTVRAPEAAGQVLVEKAKEVARSFRPHVALVDISLDGSQTNRSGITLVEELKSAWCILYSSKLSWDITREIQRRYPKVTWVDKDEKVPILLDLVHERAREASASERKLLITKADGWSEMTLKSLLGNDTSAPATLVDDILAQLFPGSHKLVLESLDQSVVTLQSVSRGRSVVMKILHDGRVEPYFVKIAPADAIEREAENYKEHIDQNLFGSFHAILMGSVVFWDLGGVQYNFLDNGGNNLISFGDHYKRQSDVQEIIRPLRHFYQVTWSRLYEQGAPAKEELGDYYKRVFKLAERLQTSETQDERIMIPGIPVPLLNPVQWLSKHMYGSSGLSYRTAVTHGDLHGDNLFVDGEHAWVIDFERSCPGHILRDFIEMEVDLFTRLGPGNSGSEIYSELMLAGLLLTSRLSPILETDLYRQITHPEIKKALDVIQENRKICVEMLRPSEFREYLWGLLFDLVYLLKLIEPNTPQYDRTLLLGGIICERLKRGTREWPEENLLRAALRLESTLVSAPYPADKGKKTVFISYSHKDHLWLERVQTHLKVLEHLGVKFIAWDDTQIKAGTRWRDAIEKALSAATVAILLVSTDFLASSFIQEKELPPMLKAAADDGTTILSIILKPCLFTGNSELSTYQSLNDPSQALSKLTEPEQDEILVKLAARIQELVG
jgi:CheY-like chemotaxis protein